MAVTGKTLPIPPTGIQRCMGKCGQVTLEEKPQPQRRMRKTWLSGCSVGIIADSSPTLLDDGIRRCGIIRLFRLLADECLQKS
uniref:Uncharacterized protein n=1 Tax=Ascaris lumbricoides TaxID=6252 RepID=A0A0M3IXP9_ASCLU